MVIVRTPPDGHRDGKTYRAEFDYDRLNRQMQAVWKVVQDKEWHTLYEISEKTGEPEQSVSARLRDLRKARFGNHDVMRRYLGEGLWEYRVAGRRK